MRRIPAPQMPPRLWGALFAHILPGSVETHCGKTLGRPGRFPIYAIQLRRFKVMQEIWSQNYDPAGNVWVSALVALIPIIFFFLALTKLRMKGYIAGTITVALALAVALLFYRMPVASALASAVYGFFYGLWPIAWIIVAAVFLYKVSVKTGQFDIIRSSILSVTEDQRLQLILVGFCFGAFLEGAAGFGASYV